MIVRFSRVAEDDLERIGDYIAADNPNRAASFLAELRERCRGLSEMPSRFPVLPQRAASGMRRCLHGDYQIFYRVSDDAVQIVRILHGARDLSALLPGAEP